MNAQSVIPHSRPWLTQADQAAVASVIERGFLAQGDLTRRFEALLADWCSAPAGIAVSSGAAAIHLAIRSLELPPGSEVILPSYVCASVRDAVRAAGATPVLCDIGEDWLVGPEQIKVVRTERSRAVVVPHLYGLEADLEAISHLGLPIIEDRAQALPASEQIKPVAPLCVLSFHPTKCITCGEGGMLLCRDPILATRARALRDGSPTTPRAVFAPLSDLAASLGINQMARYDFFLTQRQAIAQRYQTVLTAHPGCGIKAHTRPGMHYRFPLRVPGGVTRWQNFFLTRGVAVRCGVDQLLHREAGLSDTPFPNTVRAYADTLSLPIYPGMSEAEIQRCCTALDDLLDMLERAS